MENSKKIIEWVLGNSNLLDLKVKYYSGLKSYAPNIYDIGIEIKINDNLFYGRGTDLLEEIAFCKAFSESIERASLKIFNIQNTNGLAVHPILEIAKLNGRNELLERDAFFTHYLLGLGCPVIKIEQHENVNKFLNNGIEISFYEMCKYGNEIGILCIANGKNYKLPFGLIMGSAYGQNIINVADKAWLEVLRSLVHLCHSGSYDSINLHEFNLINRPGFSHHGQLSLNLEYAIEFESMWTSSIVHLNSFPKDLKFESTILDLNMFPFPDMPLNIVKTSSKSLQDIYVGKTNDENINFERLKEVSEMNNININLNLLPHPFD